MNIPSSLNSFPACGWEHPPAECRPAVLWSWNGAMTRGRITEMLEGFALRGLGGVYIHPRPGLITEYLSEEWFDLWKWALAECVRVGLECHIYDENSFPSGFAGGHVVAENPLAANTLLAGHWDFSSKRVAKPEGTLMARLTRNPETGATERVPDNRPFTATPEAPLLMLQLGKCPASLWQGGFAMADVCRAEVVERFLAITHEQYAKHVGESFGGAVRYVFTDEPETGTGPRGFHLSRAFLTAFLREHGYALEKRLADLSSVTGDSAAVRHDYQTTLNRLFTQKFATLNHDWCAAHGLRFTGHVNEHTWPWPSGAPSTMAFQRFMQTPGFDLLGFQFRSGTMREVAQWLFHAKEATSVAAQCGRGEVLCESCGGGGYGYGPAQMKPLEDFLLVMGVNRIVPHLSHQTLAGTRKYDWPQTMSDHAPWWDAFGAHALHTSRVNFLLGQGTVANRTLVLNPTTTGWIHYRPAAYHWPGENADAPLEKLRADYFAFLADLYSAQVDFDLGDECVMAELGAVADGVLTIGACAYRTVVVPPGMENLLGTTAQQLQTFLQTGGTVLCAGGPPGFLNGRPAEGEIAAHPRWIRVDSGLVERLRQENPPRLSAPDGSALPPNLLWTHRTLPDGGAVVFLANPGTVPLDAEICLEGEGIFSCDTHTGAVLPLGTVACGDGKVGQKISLAPSGHALWWIAGTPQPELALAVGNAWTEAPVRCVGCEPLEPNVLALDYCDYEGPGTVRQGIHTTHADAANWRAQGFEQNLWSVSIQFRKTFCDATVSEPSGFEVRFPFMLSEAFADSPAASALQVAVERPWHYEVFCNDIPVPQDAARRWFDEDMRLLPIGHALRVGKNLLTLRAAKFHVLAEIMPVILRGDFRLRTATPGFVLEPSEPWKTGEDWRAEGRGFFPWTVRYSFAFSIQERSEVRVTLPVFEGSAVGVVTGFPAVEWDFLPGRMVTLPAALPAGNHQLDLLLCGNLKNLLGPHFSNGLPGVWSWEDSPPTQPPGADYLLSQTGLKGLPLVEIRPCCIP